MTIEEKARDFASIVADYRIAALERVGFVCGAEWMLEKAINFIKQHDGEMIVCHTEDETDNFIYHFRKAMEE